MSNISLVSASWLREEMNSSDGKGGAEVFGCHMRVVEMKDGCKPSEA